MVEFSNEERQKFQRLMKEFIDEVERMAPQGTTTGSEPSRQEKNIDELLKKINYVSNVNYGSGGLKADCGLSFYRKDILGEGFINGKVSSPKNGVYIWFGYTHKENRLYLIFAAEQKYRNEPFDCKALEQI
ncbi:MAG: hypothetical protein J1E28_07495, partial [Helicobacter sp.]|uniref:hypothetical protein n=1 Tax=Helicobacter sp. TaxID=218 RepID=UPI0025BF4AFD